MDSSSYLLSANGSFLYAFVLVLILSALLQLIRAMPTRYPGPFIARLTKWVLRWHEIQSTNSILCHELELMAADTRDKYIDSLHKKYGGLVQIAPNQLSVGKADGVREIFAVNRRLDRPYPLPLFHTYASENLVSTESGELHQKRRRPLRSLYTARAVEGEHVQGVMKTLLDRTVRLIDEESAAGGLVDIFWVSRLFSADLMSHIIYGSENSLNTLGDQSLREEFEKDLEWQLGRLLSLWSLVLLWYPRVGMWLRHMSLSAGSLSTEVPEDLVMDIKGRQVLAKVLSAQYKPQPDRPEALMERMFQDFQETGPSPAMPNTDYILSDTLDHFWAGAGTTGEALGAAFYQLSLPRNQKRQSRLRQSLKDAGILSSSDVSFNKVRSVEYLDAVIRETLRLQPPVPFSMERKIAAEEGMNVMGHWVAPGMTVGAQAYSIHRSSDAFDNVEEWRPERWVVDDPEKYRQMKRHSFAFSAGPRMCIGMNIAMMEMKMFLARVYSMYETKLAAEWFLENGEVRPDDDRGQLWPRKNILPVERREPLLFKILA